MHHSRNKTDATTGDRMEHLSQSTCFDSVGSHISLRGRSRYSTATLRSLPPKCSKRHGKDIVIQSMSKRSKGDLAFASTCPVLYPCFGDSVCAWRIFTSCWALKSTGSVVKSFTNFQMFLNEYIVTYMRVSAMYLSAWTY